MACSAEDEAAVKNTFHHELSTVAEALYETPELLHEAQKSILADSLRSLVDQITASISSENVRFVLDEGALLHRIPWSRGSSFESILSTYGNFVSINYGEAIMVFDGYKAFTTKDMTHKRRSKGKKGVCISFDRDMNLTVTKAVFLSNSQNKQRFIKFLVFIKFLAVQCFMTQLMQIYSLSRRQLSQHRQWKQF